MAGASLVVGTDREESVTVRDGRGVPITTYREANPLTATLWRGDDQSSLASPSVEWSDADSGVATISVAAADTADLEPGTYHVQGFVGESGGVRRCFLDATITLVATAGTGTARPVYGTVDRMAVYYPRIFDLQAKSDQTNFAEQRARARGRIDEAIVAHWPGGRAAMRAALAADGLLVTGQVAEIADKFALGIVLAAQAPEAENDDESGDQAAGDRFSAQAEAMLAALLAEVDMDDDGTHETEVDLSLPVANAPAFVMSSGRLRHRHRIWGCY